ncbi:unnamed protein product [Cyprideis torosa]|uniref:Methyltransferase domain-containing protein n=1 Tax=Cyprideis torosa TaxID=163714 RepID=A0A7R8WGP6_9CRUS|nr:unnamed protein product [Cyprideis torosa]CAG0898376.1 unnamed protein product [Cyprideis torosa]
MRGRKESTHNLETWVSVEPGEELVLQNPGEFWFIGTRERIMVLQNPGQFWFTGTRERIMVLQNPGEFWFNEYKYYCNLGLIKRLTNSRPLIYSLGSNNQWDFEEFVYNFFDQKADIYTFSIEQAGNKKPHWLRYHQVAIGLEKNITQLHQELGYAGKPIHLLKVDIEGFEQLVLADLFGPDGKTCMLEIWHLNMEMHWDINYKFGGHPNLPYKLELQAQHERQLSEVCGLEKVAKHTLFGLSENTYIKVDWKDVLKQIANLEEDRKLTYA